MFYRFLIVGTFVFWLIMNGALLRLWIDPSNQQVLSVPATHVAKQAFQHAKDSNLDVFQNGKRIGYLKLSPRRVDPATYSVGFKTNLLLELPFMPQQPYSLEGKTYLDNEFKAKRIQLTIDIPLPKVVVEMDLDLVAETAVCHIQQNIAPAIETRLPLNQYGLNQILDALGIDPTVIQQVTISAKHAAGSNNTLTLSAHKTTIKMENEETQAYRMMLRQSTSPMVEGDVTLLGEIVSVNTVFGLTFQRQE